MEVRYRDNTPLVLKGVSFTIKRGEKIGVIGRTGSGKSTLVLTLSRIVPIENGSILINGVDTSTLTLSSLRDLITVIPQDAILFNGTLRYNLDPFERCSDS